VSVSVSKYSDRLEPLLKTLPENPGVYQYFDENGKIIYVGKAKNLKKRVLSYFNKESFDSGKIAVLVRKIADIRCIIVNSEYDALLLENTLIKKHQPRYNVLMKDDKTYPWICIKNEPFPRIFPTRHIIKDGSQYYGPYASVRMMNTMLDLIRQLFPLRNCNFNLTTLNINNHKFKICLEFHIGNCKGPCEGRQSEEDYDQEIADIKEIIKGNIVSVSRELKNRMNHFAELFEFEKAQIVKEKLELLERYQSKSTVVNPSIQHADVFSIISDEQSGFVNFLKVIHGAIIQSHTIEMKKKLDETDEELLSLAVTELRQRFDSNAPEVIIPFPLQIEFPKTTLVAPQRGDKKDLLMLSERNAKNFKHELQKQKDLVDPERHSKRILNQMMKDLRMNELPVQIECFDNSNIQGTNPVAAMVVFKNTRPDKKEYRHFNIKTVEGPDDYASMEEIIYRRYKRVLDEKKPLPQLIVIDGGKGQLSAALKSLERLDLRGKICIIGIAKKLEEIYYPDDPLPLYLDKKSETLKIIQQLRDEAHRFGITHHRSKREKSLIKTELTEIKGIGSSTAQSLLSELKSVNNIKTSSLSELESIIGNAKAKIVYAYFHS
jgi:excinuclease ABC subunit C